MADPKLIVRILGELDGLTKSLKEGESQLDTWADKAASVGKALTAVAVGSGLVALGKQIFDVTAATARQTEVTEQLSQQTGIAAQTFERWSVPLARVGLTGRDVALGMRQLSRNIIEAKDGSGEAAQAFARLGVDLSTIGDSESVIKAIADQFHALPDGIEKAALAQQLLGLAGAKLIPILNQGSAGIEVLTKKSVEFGLVLTDAQRFGLTQFDDALDDLGMATTGLATQLGAFLAPALTAITRDLTAATAATTNWLTEMLKVPDVAKEASDAMKGVTILRGGGPAGTLSPEAFQEAIFASKDLQAIQEQLGLEIRDQAIARFRQLQAIGRAEEALGAVQVSIIQRTTAERNAAFGAMIDQEMALHELQFQKPPTRTISEQIGQAEVTNAINERIQAEKELQVVQAEGLAFLEGRLRLDTELFRVGQITAEEARASALAVVDAKEVEALRIEKITTDSLQHQIAIDETAMAERLAIAQRFPTFWEQQLQAVEASNVFSIGLMVNTWSSAIAIMAVRGGDLKAAWEATQIAILQGFINLAVQQVATWAKAQLAMTVTSMAADATRTASTVAAASTSTAAVSASVAAQTGAMAAFATSAIAMLLSVWTVAKAVLASIAAALKASGFGTLVGLAITAALIAGAVLVASASKEAAALLGAAAAGTLALTFLQHGGIVTGPTFAMLGEAGPEAVVPLTRGGRGFGEQTIIVPVQLDGREIARSIARHMGRGFSGYGAPAVP